MDDRGVVLQQTSHYEWHSLQIQRVLAEGRTPIQRYRILALKNFGRALELNGCIQSTAFDEAIYHESLLFPAMALHGNCKRVLCFGGANGGIINRLQLNGSIEHVVQVDIDPAVYALSQYYLPHLQTTGVSAFTLERHFSTDPFHWAQMHVNEHTQSYDLIIADLPDATSDSYVPQLFTEEFYRCIHTLLDQEGVYVTQAGQVSPIDLTFHRRSLSTIQRCFQYSANYAAFIPSYGVPWGFIVASKQLDLHRISKAERAKHCQSIEMTALQHYDEQAHQHMFAHSKWLRSLFIDRVDDTINLCDIATVDVAHPLS